MLLTSEPSLQPLVAVFHLLFKVLHYFYNVTVKVDFFFFFWNRMIESSPGIWWCHVAFHVVGGILVVVPAHLFLQMQPGESWRLGPICAVTDSSWILFSAGVDTVPGPSTSKAIGLAWGRQGCEQQRSPCNRN